jgi:hypothetical protein
MSRLEFNMELLRKILNQDIDGKITVDTETVQDNSKEPEKPVVKPKRCQHDGCKVKLMLADFACRCKSFYCSQHRASEVHKCSYDYKASGKELLNKQMPTIMADKLERI